MNSTLKNLVFWMVLVVVGVLIWNFSTTVPDGGEVRSRSASSWPRSRRRQGAAGHHHRPGNHLPGSTSNQPFRTYAPSQYEGLANKLYATRRARHGEGSRPPARGRRCSTPGRRCC